MKNIIRDAFRALDDIIDVKIETTKAPKNRISLQEGRAPTIVEIPTMSFSEMQDYCNLYSCEVFNTGVKGKYKLSGPDVETVLSELRADGYLHESYALTEEDDVGNIEDNEDTVAPTVLKDIFEMHGSYILTHDFEYEGLTYTLFIECLTQDGEACELVYDEFKVSNIEKILVEILDAERTFIDSIPVEKPEWNQLTASIDDIVQAAKAILGQDEVLDKEVSNEIDTSAETKEKIAQHMLTDHSQEENLEEGALDEKIEGREKLKGHHKLFPKAKVTEENTELKEALKEYNPLAWEQGDIDLHKSIDWKARNFEDFKVEDDSFSTTVKAYGLKDDNVKKDVIVFKFLRANPIYPPYYRAAETPFKGVLGPMFDGNKHGKYGIHDRYETQEYYDMMSENKKTSKATTNLNEAEEFNLRNTEDLHDAKEILDTNDDEEPIEQVVDINAETAADLKKSYIGSAILQCPTCKTLVYRELDELVKPDETVEDGLYNEEEECPHCGAVDGFNLVGQVAALDVDLNTAATAALPAGEEVPDEEIPEEIFEQDPKKDKSEEEPLVTPIPEEDKEVKESLNEKKEKNWGVVQAVDRGAYHHNPTLTRGFILKGLTKEDAERIATTKNTPALNKYGVSYMAQKLEPQDLEEAYQDINLFVFAEDKFDRLAKRYLSEVYSNVKSYATTAALIDNKTNKIILEGKITFNSGKIKDTKFIFEAKEITKRGKLKLVGINEMFTSRKAFTLVGLVKNEKLLSESLTYNYKIDNKKVYGQIKNPTKV